VQCPRCETSGLEERERDGVTVDVCQQCRGLWLDRGELERLIARALSEQEEHERRGGYSREDDDEDHDRHEGHMRRNEHGGPDTRKDVDGRGRKRRWYESLTDMFD
jgi:Zn-finger nucleic acid-binding protein